MKQFIGATAAALLASTASAQGTCNDAVNDGGNWYCSMVKALSYNGVGAANSYNKITSMDGNSGSCQSTPFSYSGNMSPFDEEVRGPPAHAKAHNRATRAPSPTLLTILRSPCTFVAPPS